MRSFLFIALLLATHPLPGARIKYSGLTSYSDEHIKEAIAGRLEYISKRPATPSRADDASFLVESYLRTHGLPDAEVSGSLAPNDIILLTVEEGLSQFVGKITVEGFDDVEAVQNQFKAAFPQSRSRRSFEAAVIPDGLERIVDLLHSKGYWNASVKSIQQPRTEGQIPFTLRITKGPLFTLVPPLLKSPVQPTRKLLEKLQAVDGKKATAETIVKIRNTVTESYRLRGYPDISTTMLKEADGPRLRITFVLTPGEKFTVRSLQVKGLQKTKPDRFRNRFQDLVGLPYNENDANKEIKKLLSTGAFDSIRLDAEKNKNTQLDLTLHVSEADARGYSFAAGFGSIEGFVLGARYYDHNFGGRLWNLSAGAEFTSLGILGEISLTDPFFLNRDLTFGGRAFLVTRDHESYQKLQGGAAVELGWKRGQYYSATLGFETSFTTIESDIPAELIGPDDYLVNRINFHQKYDRRNDPALPSDGWFAKFDASLGFASGNGGIGFMETDAQFSYYKSLGDKSALALGLRGGIIIPTGDDEDLPIDLRKFLGGANTIRSFSEREMGADFNGDPLGGTTWWLTNAEYTYKFLGPVKGLAFFDAGSLDSGVEMAVGVGVRVDLPVGPIRFEYGRSLTRDSGEPGGAFHFAIGTTF